MGSEAGEGGVGGAELWIATGQIIDAGCWMIRDA